MQVSQYKQGTLEKKNEDELLRDLTNVLRDLAKVTWDLAKFDPYFFLQCPLRGFVVSHVGLTG